jgi:hypothetical protein
MGLFGRLRRGKQAGPAAAGEGFAPVAELAGYFLAHAVWCVSDGETLVPLVGHEGPRGRELVRFAHERLEDGARAARDWLTSNPKDALRAISVVDGFISPGGIRTDAFISTVVAYKPARGSLEIVVPYRAAAAPEGFAVFPPKFFAPVGLGDDLTGLGEAFFRGVDAHDQGGKIWAKFLDEARPDAARQR